MNSECALGNSQDLDDHIEYIGRLAQKGGPDPSDYDSLDKCFRSIGDLIRGGKCAHSDLVKYWPSFGDAFSTKTIQGFVVNRPHGYAGDFEIIDKIYQEDVTSVESLKNWDLFFHEQAATKAVRNRKQYFIDIVKEKVANHNGSGLYKILDIASGPGRDVFECFKTLDDYSNIYFECVDQDPKANRYAKHLCYKYSKHIKFQERNVFKFKSFEKYHLIWSAGLFDYLDNKAFRLLLRKLLALSKVDGEIIIGNFSQTNPTRDFMEFGHWFLNYRNPDELLQLAIECGVSDQNIFIGGEPEGVNLFLHIKT
jgi:extracellular factor (EF) 3-hydroxypalmitic acid methyl ester biosynthesis protein